MSVSWAIFLLLRITTSCSESATKNYPKPEVLEYNPPTASPQNFTSNTSQTIRTNSRFSRTSVNFNDTLPNSNLRRLLEISSKIQNKSRTDDFSSRLEESKFHYETIKRISEGLKDLSAEERNNLLLHLTNKTKELSLKEKSMENFLHYSLSQNHNGHVGSLRNAVPFHHKTAENFVKFPYKNPYYYRAKHDIKTSALNQHLGQLAEDYYNENNGISYLLHALKNKYIQDNRATSTANPLYSFYDKTQVIKLPDSAMTRPHEDSILHKKPVYHIKPYEFSVSHPYAESALHKKPSYESKPPLSLPLNYSEFVDLNFFTTKATTSPRPISSHIPRPNQPLISSDTNAVVVNFLHNRPSNLITKSPIYSTLTPQSNTISILSYLPEKLPHQVYENSFSDFKRNITQQQFNNLLQYYIAQSNSVSTNPPKIQPPNPQRPLSYNPSNTKYSYFDTLEVPEPSSYSEELAIQNTDFSESHYGIPPSPSTTSTTEAPSLLEDVAYVPAIHGPQLASLLGLTSPYSTDIFSSLFTGSAPSPPPVSTSLYSSVISTSVNAAPATSGTNVQGCLQNTFCTLAVAALIAIGTTGALALPIVGPALGLFGRRRRRDASDDILTWNVKDVFANYLDVLSGKPLHLFPQNEQALFVYFKVNDQVSDQNGLPHLISGISKGIDQYIAYVAHRHKENKIKNGSFKTNQGVMNPHFLESQTSLGNIPHEMHGNPTFLLYRPEDSYQQIPNYMDNLSRKAPTYLYIAYGNKNLDSPMAEHQFYPNLNDSYFAASGQVSRKPLAKKSELPVNKEKYQFHLEDSVSDASEFFSVLCIEVESYAVPVTAVTKFIRDQCNSLFDSKMFY